MAQISRDPFARETLEREVTDNMSACDGCGQQRTSRGKVRGLFQYITASDSGRRSAHRGLFCSKSCHDSYHS